MEQVIDGLFGELSPVIRPAYIPAANILRRGDELVYELALPGMKKDNIEVEISQGCLTVRAERKEEGEDKGRTYHLRESCFEKFERSFRLPAYVAADKAEASYENGVLTVTFPTKEEARPKTIPIR